MPKNVVTILAIGFVGGMWSGFLGLGGGVVLLAIMVTCWKVEQHVANATSLAVIFPTAIVGSLLYQHQGFLDMMLAAKIAVGCIVGAYLGSTLACRLPAATLKKYLSGALIIVGIWMVIG